ncbi:Biotin synthase [hydrothermal vent metagenome]|uniref:biotin synthase n=1 Tax=hydrothermal vent metagenome TaxID=652676 RepID=A0A3B0WBM8_9ZZZZ
MSEIRNNWSKQEISVLFDLPFNDLLFKAQSIHRENFNPNQVQISTLLSIKTGACPEDCGYCSQSAKNDAEVERERLLPLDEVIEKARIAKQNGASRFCMGAAWRNPTDKNLDKVIDMVIAVKALEMETCVTLGMLTDEQTQRLKKAGLDYYNHNLDTSPEYYGDIITTRTYQDRLDTLEHVRNADINVCSGGILGMGEKQTDRISLLQQLANLPQHPESVPMNMLVQVEGTPLHGVDEIEALDFVRSIAVARIMMPESVVRLSAGRTEMSDETQALCFFAGANSIFYGDRLLTTDNPDENHDLQLFAKLGINAREGKSEKETKQASCACG